MKFRDYDLYLTIEAFTAEWYRAWKAEHLRRHPNLDQHSINTIDDEIRWAEIYKSHGHDGAACHAVHCER